MDTRAILQLDIGFYIGVILGAILHFSVLDPCPFGRPSNVDRSPYDG